MRDKSVKRKRLALLLAALLLFLLCFVAGGGVPPGRLAGLLYGPAGAESGRGGPASRDGDILTPPDDPNAPGSGAAFGGALGGRAGSGRRTAARRGASPRSAWRGAGPRVGGGLPFSPGGVVSRIPPPVGGRWRLDGRGSPVAADGAPNWPGEVVLRPSEEAGEEALAAFTGFTGSTLDPSPSGCILTKGLPAGVSEKEWAEFLKAEGLARAAYPNFRCWPVWVPDDPQLGSQWHVDKIGLKAAWDLARGDALLVLAVCDTGIDTDHPDLAAKTVAGQNVADSPTTADVEDANGHGTAVAGMAAAVTDNGLQLAGACPTCQIMPVKISNLADGEATLLDIIEGIAWARGNGAHVINCSYNGPPDNAYYQAMDDEGALCDVDGAVLVMAAGNDNMDMGLDKPWDHVLWIGSTDVDDAKSDFSQFGGALDLSAPGTLVYVSYMGGSSGTASGTSFSSPCVAGVLGLMYSGSGFSLTPAEYRAELYASCADLGAAGKDSTFGWGRLDAYAAVVAVTLPTASASASPTSGQAPLKVTFTGSSNMDGHKALTYTWDFDDGGAGSGEATGHTYTEVGVYTVTLTVEDGDGNSDTDTVDVTVGFGNMPGRIYLWTGQRVNYLFAPSGGAAAPDVTLVGGSLPPGLDLDLNRLTGNPTQRGEWVATLRVDDGVNPTVDRNVRFYVTHRAFGRFRKHRWR